MRVSREFFSHLESGKGCPDRYGPEFLPCTIVCCWTHLRRHSNVFAAKEIACTKPVLLSAPRLLLLPTLLALRIKTSTSHMRALSGRHSPLTGEPRADFEHSSKTLSFFSF
jgi:hypothetical protein